MILSSLFSPLLGAKYCKLVKTKEKRLIRQIVLRRLSVSTLNPLVMKTVLLNYLERNKPVNIPSDTGNELLFLENQFRLLFSYANNVSITVAFQRFSDEWEEYIELTENDIINNKDKLKVVVVPTITTPKTANEVSTCKFTVHVDCSIAGFFTGA